jgi:hypothetical protein
LPAKLTSLGRLHDQVVTGERIIEINEKRKPFNPACAEIEGL